MPARKRGRLAQQAARHALRWKPLRRARCVAIYAAVGSETSTAPLVAALRRRGVSIVVPRIDPRGQGHMVFVRWLTRAPLHRARHGVPTARRWQRCAARRIDVVVVPLLGYDDRGYRLGAGGGFYDRWLARHHAYRIGLAYPTQRVVRIPSEPWDVRLRAICTAAGVHPFHFDPG